MPPDNAATVAPGADVSFPQDGPIGGAGIARAGASSFNLARIGVYQVLFQVNVDQAGQLLLTLNGEDLAFARMMEEKNGVLGKVRLAQVGDRCQVDDPAWANMHGTVVKMDRGRKRCCVEFLFDRVRRSVWVGYDLVSKAKDEESGKTD